MKVKLYDMMFSHEHDPSRIGPGGFGRAPIAWERGDCESKSVFVTDVDVVRRTATQGAENKVALVLEPAATYPDVYEVLENDDSYDYILTHNDKLLKKENALPYPAIQYHVSDFSPPTKSKSVSIITSAKKYAPGHILRHDVVNSFNGRFDLYGRGFNEIDRKEKGLRPYCFSIAIENSRSDWYFTEKILDCFASRTVPIYWGCHKIGDHFNSDGIITFDTLDDLDEILASLTPEMYQSMHDAIEENFKLVCNKYSSCEKWLYKTYPFLFE